LMPFGTPAGALGKAKSLAMIGGPRSARSTAARLGTILALAISALAFVPWQQTISGGGTVAVYDAMNRPQSVNALIPGRLAKWHVQEGDLVREGDVIAEIDDIDEKFLDPRIAERIREQRDLAITTQRENELRIDELDRQRQELTSARQDAIEVAKQAVLQAESALRAADRTVVQAKQRLRIQRQVAVRSADERARQAQDRILQSEQALLAAKQHQTTMRLRRDRIAYLEKEGLRSGQELELAENDYVASQTEVARAERALEIARRDLSVGRLAQDEANLEVVTADAAVAKAEAERAIAVREVVAAKSSLSRTIADTQAQISRVGAEVQGAREGLAKNMSSLRQAEVDLANVEERSGQQIIRAPASGRVVRLLQVGAGASVKAGDQLAIIVPTTNDRVVELLVSDNDVPLLDVGRPVRLQFAGWPAVQFDGFPSVAVGTFGGRIKVIDPLDDGTSRYRLIVEPDVQRLPGGRLDEPWPDPERLRPGAKAAGWVLLDTVPLGFEIWRQFNGFPPRVTPPPPTATAPTATGPVKLKAK
jgi:multidrug efflux pump subunit AcrA (membrane-fusion protein)